MRAAAGDELAFRRLRDRHRGLIYGIAARRYAPGLTAEDFAQEAQIAFWYATADYDPSTAVPFGAFAQLVVTRRLDSAVKQALRLKHRPVSDAFSLDAPVPGGDGPESALLCELVPSRAPSAFEVIEQRREVAAVVDAVAGMSPVEREAVIGRAVGESYRETEARLAGLGLGTKSIDNALQRARLKLADALGVDRFPLGAAA